MSNSNRATRVVKLSFAELVSSAPVASRGGGRSSDPNHCHYTVNQHRLSFLSVCLTLVINRGS